MSDRRPLRFKTEDDVLAELAQLKRGYVRRGNWTLAQVAWHVGLPLEKHMSPPPDGLERTAEQEVRKKGFVDHIIATGAPPPGAREAPPGFVPPDTAGDAEIDRYEANLRKLKAYPHARVLMGAIGPVTIEEFRACNLVHAAHHLSFLDPAPATRRSGLSFDTEDQIIAEIDRLRRGYARTGDWSLSQACWHLNIGTQARMKPGPHAPDTPEQTARRPMLEKVLATGDLPEGITAPEPMLPPTSSDDSAIDALIASLRQFKTFTGEIAPHRLFGKLSDADARKLNRIHCARHLSFLVPLEPAKAGS